MQKVRRHPFPLRGIGLRPLVSVWFQVLLTRLVAVLFIVQSPYWFTIGHRGVFSLGRWSAQLRTEVPRAPCYSGTPLNGALFLSPTGLSPSVVRPFQTLRLGTGL